MSVWSESSMPVTPLSPVQIVQNVFSVTGAEINHFLEHWAELRTQIGERMDGRADSALQKFDVSLKAAQGWVNQNLHQPALTLATAGTTSGGKSTLVNMLCGRELMPVAVGEMSAGVVTIHHIQNDQDRRLKVLQTRGAMWECGEWAQPSDAEICERLTEAMNTYNAIREHADAPQAPQFELFYPTRFGAMLPKLGLPPGCHFRILDLPGLRFIGDEGNAKILKAARDALCFFAYNSLETDPNKQQYLLEQLVQQVKEIGGSPERMMFVLNKIDVFRQPPQSWPENEEQFVEAATQQIISTITQTLEEYRAHADQFKIVKLSSKPALLAQLLNDPDPALRLRAADDIENWYRFLISKETWRHLPPFSEEWDEHHCAEVADTVWRASYGEEFERVLGEHICQHFPALVIPAVIDEFIQTAGGPASQWVLQTTSAELAGAEQTFVQKCTHLQEVRAALLNMRTDSGQTLLEPFQVVQNMLRTEPHKIQTLERIAETMRELEIGTGLREGTLAPLSSWWHTGPEHAINTVLQALVDKLTHPVQGWNEELGSLVPASILARLEAAIKMLNVAGYNAKLAQEGWVIDTVDEHEKSKITSLVTAIERFEQELEPVLVAATSRSVEQEVSRVFSATEQLLQHYVQGLTRRAHQIAPDLGFNSVPVTRNLITREFVIDFQLRADFAVTEETIEVVEGAQTVDVERPYWNPFRWLLGRTRPVREAAYVEKEQLSADIPTAGLIAKRWAVQAQFKRPQILGQFNDWLIDQIEAVSQQLSTIQEEMIAEYQRKLDTAQHAAQERRDGDQAFWQELQREAQQLEAELHALTRIIADDNTQPTQQNTEPH